ncbi:hypothetical protein M9Y10_005253 [Tritrichomonas musculus]|uniref:Protein kinase domain-containing protein n=1 Tax=Tritrichomonas musculus TaxID=1915356 RepID=A0ABR2JLL0_9EUKA
MKTKLTEIPTEIHEFLNKNERFKIINAKNDLHNLLHEYNFFTFEIKQNDKTNSNFKVIICVEKKCIIIENINIKLIDQFLEETKSLYININKQFTDNSEIKEEVLAFCEHFPNLIKPIAAYLIRRYFYPSSFFRDPSFFNFESKINDYYENDFIYLRILHSTDSFTFYLVFHKKYFHLFILKQINKNDDINKEINFCKKFQNRSFVPFYGFVKRKNQNIIGFIYEFMPNGTLSDYFNQNKEKISNFFSFTALIRIFNGINHLHSHHCIHRDLKPSNILINHDFEVCINDFGTIKELNNSANANTTFDFGSAIYSSPEQMGGRNVSYPTDIFSFGSIIYFLFERKDMFKRDYNMSYISHIRKNEIPQMTNVSKDVQELCNKCVKYNPNERPSMDDIKNILYKIIRSLYFFDQYFIVDKMKSIHKEEMKQFINESIFFISEYMHKNTNCFTDLQQSISKGEISDILYQIGRLYIVKDIVSCDYNKAMEYYQLSAEYGSSYGIDGIGNLYFNGWGVEKNYAEAQKHYKMAAEKNNPKSLYMMGYIYMNGIEVNIDYIKAKKCFESSSKQNFSQAFVSLGDLYLKGKGVDQNIEKAIFYYEKGKSFQNVNAILALGNMYFYGNKVGQNYKTAREYYELAAQKNNPKALYYLGYLYYYGYGVDRNYEESKKYFEMAEKYGNIDAYFILGKLYHEGKGVEQDYDKALNYYELAAKQNDSDALNGIGLIYYKFKKDYTKAFTYFERSAALENYYAYNNLAEFYIYGYVGPKDYPKAKYYYELSSKQNNTDAFIGLGNMYYKGYGVKKDFTEAIKYYMKAVNDKHSDVFYKIGKIFFKQQNYVNAKEYFEKASIFNHPLSYFYLGIIYFKGLGVEQDYKLSFNNFLSSSQLNYFKAFFYVGLQYERGLGVETNYINAIYYYKKCLDCEKFHYFIDYKNGSIEKQKANANYRYLSANNAAVIYLFFMQNTKEAENYFKISSNNEYPIGQNNFALFNQFFLDNEAKADQIFNKASKNNFDLIEFNFGRLFELNNKKEEAYKHYERALSFENNILYYRSDIIEDERLEKSRLFINCYLYLKFIFENESMNNIKDTYRVKAIFRPIFKLLIQSHCKSFSLLIKNNKINLKNFFIQFPLFNLNYDQENSENEDFKIEEDSKEIKYFKMIIANDEKSNENLLYSAKLDKYKNEEQSSFYDTINCQTNQIILKICEELNQENLFTIKEETNEDMNLIQIKVNHNNTERFLQYPKNIDFIICNTFHSSAEIKEIMDIMEEILFSNPSPILFGRFPDNSKNIKNKSEQIKRLFYEGLGTLDDITLEK